ncbi:MAG: ATP-grasp domain-containing protein [Fuerstiella sp.]|nr:ATP-grasp domain-containing protein [Fuerstiella sp.]
MPQPNVILIGASVRSFAQSALRDGIRPVCVDMFCDSDLRMSLRKGGLKEAFWCRPVESFADAAGAVSDVDPNVPAVVLGGFENHTTGFRHLSSQRTTLGSDGSTIEQLRNPQCLFPQLQARGCWIPRFHVRGQGVPGHEPGLRWLRKNRFSAGGQGVRWYAETDELRRKQSESVLTDDLQEFIDGIPISASFLAVARSENESAISRNNAVLLGCALQLSGCDALHAAEFHFCGNVGPLKLSAALTQQVADAGNAVMAEWSVAGLFGIDFVVRDGRPFVVEVNPRPTASHELHELAQPGLPGHVLLQLWPTAQKSLQAAEAYETDAVCSGYQNERHDCTARFVIYADQDVEICSALETELLKYRADGRRCALQSFWLADIPSSDTSIPAGTPLCSLYADLSAKDLQFSELGPLLELLPLSGVLAVEDLVQIIQAQLVVLVNDGNFVN